MKIFTSAHCLYILNILISTDHQEVDIRQLEKTVSKGILQKESFATPRFHVEKQIISCDRNPMKRLQLVKVQSYGGREMKNF